MSPIFQTITNIPFIVPLITGSVFPISGEIDTINQRELQATTLYQMEDVPNTFDTLFWDQQVKTLLKFNDLGSRTWKNLYSSVKHLKYPLLYPKTLEYFPLKVTELIEKIRFSNREKKYLRENNVIVVLRTEEEKVILGYYEDQILKLSTYVSIWARDSKTKEGVFRIIHRETDRRSRKNKWDPMPYALQYDWDYFLHRWDTSEVENSHWCIRVPWLYEKRLYEHIPEKTAIIIHKPYEISLEKNS